MADVGSRQGSAKSGMSQERRQRLMDIQKREQLKGMLVNKFKLKYGDKPQLSKYIDNEVARFLKNGRLTEDNLRGLDTKISKEAELREKKEAILVVKVIVVIVIAVIIVILSSLLLISYVVSECIFLNIYFLI